MAIVFLHLQKTGGSTVHALLKERLPPDRFARRTRAGHIVWDAYRDSDEIVVSGHVTAAEVRQSIRNPRIFTVLRQPESRLLSHFYFLKSHSVELLESYQSPLLLRIKAMSLEEFLQDVEIEAWLRDYYVKNLDPDRGGPEADFDRASAFLSTCEAVGTMDQLGAFVGALFKALDLEPPETIPRLNSLAARKDRTGYDPIEIARPSPAEETLLRSYAANDQRLFRQAGRLASPAGARAGSLSARLRRIVGWHR
jgi:hypothetical protein